jgi:hypothetical protein
VQYLGEHGEREGDAPEATVVGEEEGRHQRSQPDEDALLVLRPLGKHHDGSHRHGERAEGQDQRANRYGAERMKCHGRVSICTS